MLSWYVRQNRSDEFARSEWPNGCTAMRQDFDDQIQKCEVCARVEIKKFL